VIVAFGAAQRASQPIGAQRPYSIRSVLGKVFLGLQASFRRRAAHSVIGRSDLLLDGRVGQEIARQLLARELVKRFVVAKGLQNVIAIGPCGAVAIAVVARGIGVAHSVQPAHRFVLGIGL